MTAEERHEARERWGLFLAQHQKCEERAAWIDENADHELYEERNEALLRSARRFGQMGDDLATWSGVDSGELVRLLLEIEARRTAEPE